MSSPDFQFCPPPVDVPIIGMAGGIGSGKSLISGILKDLGCVVTDSDADVKAELQKNEVRAQLVEWWGDTVLNEAGEVDRAAVARIVFQNEAERKRLESFIHPRVEARRQQFWAAEAEKRAVPAFVIDAPLLFEVGINSRCDAIIFVDSPYETRRQRVAETRGWDEAELNRREKNQWPLDTKRNGSDHVVLNEGHVEVLRDRVRTVFVQILHDFNQPDRTGTDRSETS